MTSAGQEFYPISGLLWWRFPESSQYKLDEVRLSYFEEHAVPDEILEKLKPAIGIPVESITERNRLLEEIFGETSSDIKNSEFRSRGIESIFEQNIGEIVSLYGDGYPGKYIVVVPESDIVAVRQIVNLEEYNSSRDGFNNFIELVSNLTRL